MKKSLTAQKSTTCTITFIRIYELMLTMPIVVLLRAYVNN